MFFLAMVLFPEHQARAQKEIDAAIGPGRLPELHDHASLPYIECILQETLRFVDYYLARVCFTKSSPDGIQLFQQVSG